MRVAVMRNKQYKGVLLVCDIKFKENAIKVLELEPIAELNIDDSDTVYTVLEAESMQSDNKIISNTPDYLCTGNPVEISTDFEKIKECIESELQDNKNISLTAFSKSDNKFKNVCSVLIRGKDRYAAYDTSNRRGA